MARVRTYGGKAHAAVRIGNNAGLVDAETVGLGAKTFEWDNNASVTAGNILVTIGVDADASAINLRNAINANKPNPGVTASLDPVDSACVRLIADARWAAGNMALTEGMVDAANIISGATLLGGENSSEQTIAFGDYTVTALDVAAASVQIPTGHASARSVQLEVRDSAGVFKEDLTGQVTVVAGEILHGFEGAIDLAAGDVISWWARA